MSLHINKNKFSKPKKLSKKEDVCINLCAEIDFAFLTTQNQRKKYKSMLKKDFKKQKDLNINISVLRENVIKID